MQAPPLDPKSLHVWTIELTAPGEELAPHRALLDAEERPRADRFLVPKASERFVVARSASIKAPAETIAVLSRSLAPSPCSMVFGSQVNRYSPPIFGSSSSQSQPFSSRVNWIELVALPLSRLPISAVRAPA